ncbi:hypothetical protein AGRA3207_002568 [Actinomadura graeca]|uniref:Molecular chaperone DnaJ n=1 Tax=Actinomadura graeca TaxID=2750812 RepID=A0ABX8QSJ5_9ACTN|nr:hypothetical protein [Actinomadura graeca]QXJ21690.1 hypothetical protein AGRA3207_002568 [Actinomadura graeca]
MSQERDRRPRKCAAGGHYAEVNGQSNETARVERPWVTCTACGGGGAV